jgi:POT family proton-dependent oligopeptide transporter
MGPRTDAANGNSIAIKQRTFLGHPIGLYVLFFTEMWERFSYYGMRAILILYLVKYLKWSQENASGVYKWYTSLVYLTPLLGGYLADRYLGNKRAVIIGAVLMAIGHFLMAFEPTWALFSALVFLIFGNGFFKPNMSTQVGRLYPQNDPRRDGAYTIFYMGINLGAFLSPLVCGWLAANTLGRYHSGFTIAGIGMVCGLLVYLLGQHWVIELDQTREPVTLTEGDTTAEPNQSTSENRVLSEGEAERSPTAAPLLNRSLPLLFVVAGIGVAVGAPILALVQLAAWNTVIGLEIAAVCALISAWITSKVHMAVRDRVLAIYILGIFVVFFWAAFEQAGNALNQWADQTTDRNLTTPGEAPAVFPDVPKDDSDANKEESKPGFMDRWLLMFKPIPKAEKPSQTWTEWFLGYLNPVPAEWFQSINALAIFVLAPFFSFLWVYLARRGVNPSTPTKMAIGVLLLSVSFALMMGAARNENLPTSVQLKSDHLPEAIELRGDSLWTKATEDEQARPCQAGRLTWDASTHTLHMTGVLPDIERERIVRETAPAEFVAKLKELQEQTKAKKDDRHFGKVTLSETPPGLNLKYAGFREKDVHYDPSTRELTANIELGDKDVKTLAFASGDPTFRDAADELYVESSKFRVSPWWLFWFYILNTVGELCLSPVGLSMVSKLAPAKFATMLMGLWLLTSFFGNFAAGAMGERWGTIDPLTYFLYTSVALGIASIVLFVLVRKVIALMHGVK